MGKIKILECGPRDGWQNLTQYIPTEKKLELIDGLVSAGISAMEVSSFVSPKAIPQMADAAEVASHCVARYPDIEIYALVPNMRGAKNAWEAGIRRITYVVSLSETHNKANINRTREASLEELGEIIKSYPELDVCIGLATTFGCPFEGIPQISDVVDFSQRLYDTGVRKISLSDTIGIADPAQVRRTIAAVRERIPDCELQVHIHDTRGMGLACTLAAIECGVKVAQSTLGGLGGCPFAPGASGNTATEDLVYMLDRMGYDCGIDFEKLVELSRYQKSMLEGVYSGHQVCIQKNSCCTGQS